MLSTFYCPRFPRPGARDLLVLHMPHSAVFPNMDTKPMSPVSNPSLPIIIIILDCRLTYQAYDLV